MVAEEVGWSPQRVSALRAEVDGAVGCQRPGKHRAVEEESGAGLGEAHRATEVLLAQVRILFVTCVMNGGGSCGEAADLATDAVQIAR